MAVRTVAALAFLALVVLGVSYVPRLEAYLDRNKEAVRRMPWFGFFGFLITSPVLLLVYVVVRWLVLQFLPGR